MLVNRCLSNSYRGHGRYCRAQPDRHARVQSSSIARTEAGIMDPETWAPNPSLCSRDEMVKCCGYSGRFELCVVACRLSALQRACPARRRHPKLRTRLLVCSSRRLHRNLRESGHLCVCVCCIVSKSVAPLAASSSVLLWSPPHRFGAVAFALGLVAFYSLNSCLSRVVAPLGLYYIGILQRLVAPIVMLDIALPCRTQGWSSSSVWSCCFVPKKTCCRTPLVPHLTAPYA